MKLGLYLKNKLQFIFDDHVEIRIRMLFVLQYATLAACLVGTVSMIVLRQPFYAIAPNIVLLFLTLIGFYFSKVRKMYDLSAIIIIIGCADITLPFMFFAAGGYNSGMPIWFVFGVTVACMMSNGRTRFLMITITIIEDVICMFVAYFHSELVIPLTGEGADFFDMVQSFVVVCIGLTIILIIHISTYDRQRRMLEYQRSKLEIVMHTDELTGAFNRRAYYDAVKNIIEINERNNLVVAMMDVNGLKAINDTMGHSAGDNLLVQAAKVMQESFASYGEIYRLGGDEFAALLHCTDEEYKTLSERLESCMKTVNISIAAGFAKWSEHSDLSFYEIERMADTIMYQNKSEYYRLNESQRRS